VAAGVHGRHPGRHDARAAHGGGVRLRADARRNALLPLLATSAVAYGFTVLTMRRSILTEKIARRGHHIYREYGIDPLERHSVAEVMTSDAQSRRLIGIVSRSDLIKPAFSLHAEELERQTVRRIWPAKPRQE
jgi:hypothetical protein